MTDAFALLGLPRRPWLEPEAVKDAFHRLGRERHPDASGGNAADFAGLNDAQGTLADPRRRLAHLLALEYPGVSVAGPAPVPTALGDLVFPTQGFLQTLDAFLARKAAAPGALARALLAREEMALHEDTETRLAALEAKLAEALAELRAFDAETWDAARTSGAADALLAFQHRLAYLARWTEQFRERLFQLSV